jgi:hypothetical protein
MIACMLLVGSFLLGFLWVLFFFGPRRALLGRKRKLSWRAFKARRRDIILLYMPFGLLLGMAFGFQMGVPLVAWFNMLLPASVPGVLLVLLPSVMIYLGTIFGFMTAYFNDLDNWSRPKR